jgi:RIO kinase 1
MRVLWEAGVNVPYPVSYAEDIFILEYVGAEDGAAPQLARAKLDSRQLEAAAAQMVAGLEAIVATGWVHGDLSAYNLLGAGARRGRSVRSVAQPAVTGHVARRP